MSKRTIYIVGFFIVVIVLSGFTWWFRNNAQTLQYRNDQYGFTFALPQDWKGYTILDQTWSGDSTCPTGGECSTESGPEIVIRNPNWTAEEPWQDIPIMVFTPDEWNAVKQGTLIVSAAPVPPTELGSNAQYVFALPARYDYAYPQGWQEVEDVLKNNPLSTKRPTSSSTATTSLTLYTNATYGFSFQYPPSYKVINDQVSSDNSGKRVSVTLQSSEDTLLQVYGETTAHQCYINLCDLPAKEQEIYNGITWDYLGETNYCDAGSCGASEARYRTSKNDMNYYLSFSEPTDAEGVLQTFKFGR